MKLKLEGEASALARLCRTNTPGINDPTHCVEDAHTVQEFEQPGEESDSLLLVLLKTSRELEEQSGGS